nr:uncharacterized protein LOC113822669 [Penaeus vannamei]
MRPCPSKHGRSPGGTGKGAGSEHAGLAGWFGRLRGSASPAFRHVNPTLGPNGWQAGMAGAGARGGLAIRANSDGRESKPSTSSGNVRTRTCVPPGPANSPGRNRWREGQQQQQPHVPPQPAAAAPEPPARSRIKASPLVLLRNPPGPGPLLDLLSPLLVTSPPARPGPPFQEGTGNREAGRERGREKGERPERGEPTRRAVSPHSQEILVAAFPENGRGLLLSTPAAVRTVSREAMSRHSREGGSRPSKKAQGRRNPVSTPGDRAPTSPAARGPATAEPPALPPNRSLGVLARGQAASTRDWPAGLVGFGGAPLRPFGTLIPHWGPMAGRQAWPARGQGEDWPSAPTATEERATLHVFRNVGTCVPPGPANSPGRNRWREGQQQQQPHVPPQPPPPPPPNLRTVEDKGSRPYCGPGAMSRHSREVAAVLRRRHRAAAMCVRHVDGITENCDSHQNFASCRGLPTSQVIPR